MEACVMFFFRDRQVYDMLSSKPNIPLIAVGPNEKPIGLFPPNSILPV
jgi:hypothetical protein